MTNTTKQAENHVSCACQFGVENCPKHGTSAKPIQAEPVAQVDANDDEIWADILPNSDVKVGQFLYTADTVRALQLEAIRKTLEVAASRILDDHSKVKSPLYQLRQIDPEEILKGLTP